MNTIIQSVYFPFAYIIEKNPTKPSKDNWWSIVLTNPGQNATAQNATAQNVTAQNVTAQNVTGKKLTICVHTNY